MPQQGVVTEQAVLDALRNVQDPDLNRDIVSLGFVKKVRISGGDVRVTLELTTPACPVRERFKEEARRWILGLPGATSADIDLTSQVRSSARSSSESSLPGVRNVIPVASGKGGVGKSTVSANIALALARAGARVGLMDADVYGPSIPRIMGITAEPVTAGERIMPVEQHGVKVMSMAFFLRDDQAVIWRGPMLAKMVEQFIAGVEWGELDYLIIDLPPGTGDVQLTLCQRIPLTGAAIVSTPQDVALRVAEKAIHMFRQLNTPILGLIENMSHYICRHCGQRDDIFGSGGGRRASERLIVPFLGEIPLSGVICEETEQGRPSVIANPESPQAKAFTQVAEKLVAQISIANMRGDLPTVELSF